MKKRTTQAEKQRQELEQIRIAHCERYKISEQAYFENEFETGLLWLEKKGFKKEVSYSKTFWSWWRLTLANAIKIGLHDHNEMEKINMLDYFPASSILKQIENETQSCIA